MIRLKSLLLEFDLNAPGELDKAKEIVNGLQSRGFSYTGAIALAGNIAHESGCEPDKKQKGGTGAYGLCQWDPGAGRLQALQEFAKMTNQPIGSLKTQLDFMQCELINGYVWNGKPIPNINKKLIYTVDKSGKILGLANYYVKKYKNSIVDGDIAKSAANLMDNIFTPIAGSKQQRIDNALKIDKYIKGGSETSKSTTADTKSTAKKYTAKKYTAFPNPSSTGDMITVTVNKDILPLDSIDLNVVNTAGRVLDKHHWDNVQQGILKFAAPDEVGIYILQMVTGNSDTDDSIKLMVQ